MPIQSAKEWVRWVYDNNFHYSGQTGLMVYKINKMSDEEALAFCQEYIKAMVKKDGKRNILYQEKQMIHQLGLEV